MSTIYEEYNGYVSDMRDEIIAVHDAEQQNLATNIGAMTDVLVATSNENHELMDSFVSKMPNSRDRTSVNQNVVNNTVQPIAYSYDYMRNVNGVKPLNVELFLGIIMVILLALSGAVLVFAWWRDRAALWKSGVKEESVRSRYT